jgi:hypothetical protein
VDAVPRLQSRRVAYGRASLKPEFAASPTPGDFRHDKQPNTDVRLAPLENGLSDSNANRASCPPPRTKAHGATAATDLGTRRQTACPCLRIKASGPKRLGAILGARRDGQRRTSADAHRGWAGILGVTPDPAARSGRPAATYGSDGSATRGQVHGPVRTGALRKTVDAAFEPVALSRLPKALFEAQVSPWAGRLRPHAVRVGEVGRAVAIFDPLLGPPRAPNHRVRPPNGPSNGDV